MTSAAGIDVKTVNLPDGRSVSYTLTRKPVKNINFRVSENGIVSVSANSRVSVKFIEELIEKRADFFLNAAERLKNRAELFEANLNSVRYLGRDYPVRIIENSREIAVLDESECRVFTKSKDKKYIKSLLENAVLTRFKALCEELDREVRNTLREKGFPPPPAKITIKDMKSRWGSCSYYKGHISINSRLAAYPKETVLSVFYHEYAHFRCHDHSKAFYDFLLMIYPEYYEHNRTLK